MRPSKAKLELFSIVAAMVFFAFLPSLPAIPLCPILHFTGHECPTCGTTRSLWFILHGRFADAWVMNPIGFAVLLIFHRRIVMVCNPPPPIKSVLESALVNRILLSAFFLFGFVKIF